MVGAGVDQILLKFLCRKQTTSICVCADEPHSKQKRILLAYAKDKDQLCDEPGREKTVFWISDQVWHKPT